jgi:hypothetical protein
VCWSYSRYQKRGRSPESRLCGSPSRHR